MGEAKLHVVLLSYTPDPETLITKAATLCYSPAKIDELTKWITAAQKKSAFLIGQQIELIGDQVITKCNDGTLKREDCDFMGNLVNSALDSQNAYARAVTDMQNGITSQEHVQEALETLWGKVLNLVGEAISRGIKIKVIGSSNLPGIKGIEEAFDLQRIKRIEDLVPQMLIDKLLSMGHVSPFEHASFTFGVEGISRACSHQLVRHRIASYSQQSQRYVGKQSKKTGGIFDFIIPPSVVAAGKKEWFIEKMQEIQKWYDELVTALGGGGEKAYEDARFLLPNAAETKIIITMNARELLHFFRVRCCERAQWEIRELATEMLRIVRKVAPNIFGKSGPACLVGSCTEGAFYCGKIEEVRKKYRNLPF